MISSSILQNSNNTTLKSNDILLKKYEIDVNKIKLPRNLKNKIESSLTCVDSEILSSDEDLKIDEESSIEHLIGDEDLSTKTTRHCVKFINRDGKIVKIFECGICNKNFTHQYTLMRHLPMHTNERNFICNDCGKAFRQLSTLSQHRAIHSVDRPFTCETCEKSFNRISTLISHRKTHSDEKPYRCHLCNKSFHQKGNLRNHIYIHTNERPYRCALCNKGFNQMSNLVCHAQKAHSAQLPDSWSCTHCSKRFQKRSLLRAHELETHHFQMPVKTISSTTLHKIKTPYSQKNTTFVLPPVSSSPSSVTSTITTKSEISESAIVIPAIDTDAMKKTKKNHEIPFAILHFIEGQPLLVRVIDVGNGKSLLRPVNTEDFTMLRRQSEQQQQNPNKNSAEILMPIVAAIFQTLNSSGEPDFEVKSPKNIYKFPNLENLLNYEYNKNTQNQQQQSAMAIGVKVQFNLNNSNNNNNNSKNININSNNSNLNNNINDNNQNQQINIKNEYQNFNDIKKDTTISWNGDLNEILSNTNNNNINESNNNNNIEDQKAVAIVQDCNWWKKDDEKQNLSTMIEPKIENFIKNDQFLNLGTNNLLTPKRGDEQFELLPSLNLENNNLLSNSAAGNMEDDEININLIRNFLTENRKFFADIDDLVAELFQQ